MVPTLFDVFTRRFRSNPVTDLQNRISAELRRALLLPQPNFPNAINLPSHFGKGLPERAIELLLARSTYHDGVRLLDVGYANSMLCHLEMLKALPKPTNITGIDIAVPSFDATQYYTNCLRCDISCISLADSSIDLIWCISSLEHFGLDNSHYTRDFAVDSNLPTIAISEMLRVLVSGGQLLITVPYGRFEDHGWQINYDWDRWQSLLSHIRPAATVCEMYFRHTFGNGWTQEPATTLSNVGYFDQANSGAGAVAVALVKKTAQIPSSS